MTGDPRRRWRRRRGLVLACAAVLLGSVAARIGPRDRDGDGIRDDKDPFPDDADRPGRAAPGRLYANTSARLFEVIARDDGGVELRDVGPFFFSDGVRRSVTDIAVDPWGVMWASSFDAVMVCDPRRARCEVLAPTTASLNALEHARAPTPAGSAHDVALYAASTDGGLHLVHRDGKVVRIGTLRGPSSGDLTPLGAFIGAVRDDPQTGADHLIELDPTTLAARDAGSMPGDEIYGLARCDDRTLFAFDASGAIHASEAGEPRRWTLLERSAHPWWGASCAPTTFGLPGDDEADAAALDAGDPRAEENGRPPKPGDPEAGRSWCGVW